MDNLERSKKLNDLFDSGNFKDEEALSLIKGGINPSFKDKGFNLLHTYLSNNGGNVDVVKHLIEQGVDVREKNKYGNVYEYYNNTTRCMFFPYFKEISDLLKKGE